MLKTARSSNVLLAHYNSVIFYLMLYVSVRWYSATEEAKKYVHEIILSELIHSPRNKILWQ